MFALRNWHVRVLAIFVLTVSGVARGGKPERDQRNKEEAILAAGIKEIKSTCGCGPEFKIDWDSYKSYLHMERIGFVAKSAVLPAARAVCQTKADKAAFCKGIKGVTIKIFFKRGGNEFSVSPDGKLIKCGTDDLGLCGEGQMQSVFDRY